MAGCSRSVFDYGDHRQDAPRPEPDRPGRPRSDPFSTYRPGFEVRTYRRCHRVLMFHHFPDEPGVGADCLVSSTDLTYASTGGSGMTTVASVTHTGYRRRDGGSYHGASLPPLELRYSPAVIGAEVRELSPETLANLPAGVDGTAYQWVDLDGEGLSGILARQGGAWYYKPNLGDGPVRAAADARHPARDGRARRAAAAARPGRRRAPGRGRARRPDARLLPADRRPTAGSRSARSGRCPNISWDDPDLRMVDLDGDGLADVLITGDDAFTWYPSLGLDGFGDGRRAFSADPWSEERGPRVMLADPEQTIYLADMSGDGLSDLVRVRNGEVCYWPNTRLRAVRRQGDHGPQPLDGPARPLRPAARPAGRRGRHGQRRPDLPAPRRHPGVPQPVRQRVRRAARPAAGVPAAGQPGPRHGGRPARPRAPRAWSGPRRCRATPGGRCATST